MDILAQLGPQDTEPALRLDLFRDGVRNVRPIHFQADVPPGSYRIRTVIGYPAATGGGNQGPQYGLRVHANAGFPNEQLVTHEVDPRNGFAGVNVATLNTKAQFNTTLGSTRFTDVGLGLQDLSVTQVPGSHVDLKVTFHNVGNQDVSAVPYQVGVLLLPSTRVFLNPPGASLTLAAPNSLIPQTQDFTLQVPTPGIGFPLSFVFFGLVPAPDGNPDNHLAWGVFTIQ